MSGICSIGDHLFSILFLIAATFCFVSVFYGLCKFIQVDVSPTKLLFHTQSLFLIISMLLILNLILYGCTKCNYMLFPMSQLMQTVLFDKILTILYMLQLYFLWLVLLARIYCVFRKSHLKISKKILLLYSLLLITFPSILPIVVIQEFHDIFSIISLVIALFITLSISIQFIRKLIEIEKLNKKPESMDKNSILFVIIKSSLLATISAICNVMLIVILCINQSVNLYKSPLFDSILLIDVYTTTIYIILSCNFCKNLYFKMCGGVHSKCYSIFWIKMVVPKLAYHDSLLFASTEIAELKPPAPIIQISTDNQQIEDSQENMPEISEIDIVSDGVNDEEMDIKTDQRSICMDIDMDNCQKKTQENKYKELRFDTNIDYLLLKDGYSRKYIARAFKVYQVKCL